MAPELTKQWKGVYFQQRTRHGDGLYPTTVLNPIKRSLPGDEDNIAV